MSSETPDARLVAALQKVTAKLEASEYRRREPIAIVGIGCRFPGAELGPASFWELLREGREARAPITRWSADKLAGSRTQHASLLGRIDEFDPAFFQITPREARVMDPQQRMALEVAYEAITDAAIPLATLRERPTGVFLGVGVSEYRARFVVRPETLEYSGIGNVASVAAGRISYVFDLKGPCVALDTSCSSSLVAIHTACESLRLRTSDVAIAGGVNAIASWRGFLAFSALNALSPDGRSKAFDASGDGYGRGEGCGIVALKRLSDAQRDGDRIYAVIRGSAINSDGYSSGLTAPNPDAQQRVIRAALELAGIAPDAVQYIEAHGTGTVLGDPIEVEGLSAVFGRRTSTPLAIGTVKTNIGHLEASAGVAGLIKMALALRHRQLPATLHFKTPNPHIAWDRLPLRVHTELGAWPEPDAPLIAGISSFGLSGTNAHVVVENAPAESAERATEAAALATAREPHALLISAQSSEALSRYAARFADMLDAPRDDDRTYRDIAYTTSVRSTHLPHRLAVVGDSSGAWSTRLRQFVRGERDRNQITGTAVAAPARPRVAMVFGGQGSQWFAMGRELYRDEAVFRTALDRVAALIDPLVDYKLTEELARDESTSRLAETRIAQPALFALQFALVELWKSCGVVPDAVAGHSLGEVTAAVVAGALSIEQAARLIVVRATVMQRATGLGQMAAVAMSAHDAERFVIEHPGVEIAASNGPRAITLSGPTAAIDRAVAALDARGVDAKVLRVDYAFHHAMLEPLARELAGELRGLEPTTPAIKMISTLTGEPAPRLDAAYWGDQVRQRVRFHDATRRLLADGATLFVEISPHPVLLPAIDQAVDQATVRATLVASMRRHEPERAVLVEALAAAHCAGYPVDWNARFAVPGRVVSVPLYPWQRQSYWVEEPDAARQRIAPLLHRHVALPEPTDPHVLELDLDRDDPDQRYLADYHVDGGHALPACALVEQAYEASARVYGARLHGLADVHVERPVTFDPGERRIVQVVIEPAHDRFRVFSRAADGSNASSASPSTPTLHARGTIIVARSAAPPPASPTTLQERCARALGLDAVYADDGGYGVAFRALADAYAGENEALGKLQPASELPSDLDEHQLHPALLEAGFQLIAAATDRAAYVPTELASIVVHDGATLPVWVHARWQTADDRRGLHAEIAFLGERGQLIAAATGARLDARRSAGADPLARLLYTVAWRQRRSTANADTSGSWLVFADRGGTGDALCEQLTAAGARVVTVHAGTTYARHGEHRVELAAEHPEHYERLLGELFSDAPPRRIVHLWSLDAAEPTEPAAIDGTRRLTATSVAHIAQAVARRGWDDAPRLFVVTRGAQAASGPVTSVAQSAVWGVTASLVLELPELATTAIDLDPADRTGTALFDELVRADREDRIALRGSERLVARLERHARRASTGDAVRIRPDRTYLVTGGLGSLGLVIAAGLVERGARFLALFGRRSPSVEARRTIAALEAAGVRVAMESVDVADRDALATAVASLSRQLPPLAGVVHAAGVADDRRVLGLDDRAFAEVMAPKVRGAWNLHVATRDLGLDWFVAFSSISSVLGLPQAHYAAANAFLDGLASWRRGHGLPMHSVSWGPWADTRMAGGRASGVFRQGFAPIEPADGTALFHQVLDDVAPHVAIVDVQWRQWRQLHPRAARIALLADLASTATTQTSTAGIAQELASADQSTRGPLIAEYLRGAVAKISGIAADKIGFDVPLATLGLDSLMIVALKNVIERDLGLTVSAAVLYARPTLDALLTWIATKLSPAPKSTAIAVPVHNNVAQLREPIAIVGMACRFPAAEDGIEAFWSVLRDGRDVTAEITRWPVHSFYDAARDVPGKAYTKRAALLSRIDEFEPAFFQISPREAEVMDPQQRLVLEVVYEAVADAAIPLRELQAVTTGMFLGLTNSGYGARFAGRPESDIYAGTGNNGAVAAGRVAYAFDLKGPCVTLDTACSSALVAIHSACESLRLRTSDTAIAGGVKLYASPAGFIRLSALTALAPDGRCKTWDASGDGYGRGEGCGMVVLKRLADAQRDGDRIYAVVRGSAINSDGRTSGLTAPNPLAQQRVIRAALELAEIQPDAVQYVEAHGTGTVLGDPIEVEALAEVFGNRTGAPLSIGSVKTNIGHLEESAGVAGVIKTVLAMRHRQLPASLHFETPNPHIAWDRIPIRVQTALGPWPQPDAPLIAGVSAFGLSGTNAHAVLEQPPEEPAITVDDAPHALVISAQTPEALAAYAARFADMLDTPRDDGRTYRDIAYTSSVRASHHEHRLAVVGDNMRAWSDHLRAFARGEPSDGVATGIAAPSRPRIGMVFGGQGSQWFAMGRELYRDEPVFRAAMDRVAALVDPLVDFKLLDELARDEATSRLAETRIAQPALFALHVALVELWKSCGVAPDAVAGHSLGEIAAAYAAGALSLEQAVRLVVIRGQILQRATGHGRMAAIAMSLEEAEQFISEHPGVEIAAHNGPRAITLCGPREALDRAIAALTARGGEAHYLHVDYAFHHASIAPLAHELSGAVRDLSSAPPAIRMYSTVTGEPADRLDAAYWGDQVRRRVRFFDATRRMLEEGVTVFIEIGTHPVLLPAIDQLLDQTAEITLVSSLRRRAPERATFVEAVATVHCAGYPVDWRARFSTPGRVVSLPAYPWQRQRYWVDESPPAASSERVAPAITAPPASRATSDAPGTITVAERIRAAASDQRHTLALDYVRATLAGLIGSQRELPSTTSIGRVGVDSIVLVRMRTQLKRDTGVALPAAGLHTKTLGDIARLLVDKLAAASSATPAGPSVVDLVRAATGDAAKRAVIHDFLRSTLERLIGQGRELSATTSIGRVGVDSIVLVRLRTQIKRAAGVELPAAGLHTKTLGDLVGMVLNALGSSTPADDARAFEMHRAQPGASHRAMLGQIFFRAIADQYPEDTDANTVVFTIEGPLDVAAMRTSIDSFVHRHSAFWTQYEIRDGELTHRVPPLDAVPPVPFDQRDISQLDAAQQATEQQQFALAQKVKPFDMDKGPFLRAGLLRLAPDRHVLVVATHHIAFDAGAIAGMVREISSFYGQHSGQRPLSDDPRPFQYIDYAASMERWEASTNGRKHRAYWEESLRGATPIALPVDFSRDDVDARRDAAPLGFAHDPMHVYRHSAASVPSVAKLAERTGTSAYAVFLAQLARFVRETTGQTDLCIETLYALRGEAELANMQGMLTNVLVTRIDASGTLDEITVRTKIALDNGHEHGYARVSEVAPHPLRRVGINYVPMLSFASPKPIALGPSTLAYPQVGPTSMQNLARPWDLQLVVQHAPDEVRFRWICSQRLFERETGERWFRRYLELLNED